MRPSKQKTVAPPSGASVRSQAGTGADRRTRRSTEEVRRIILAAAQDMFAEGGYAGTSTRAIARRCEVAEYLIFRHFGSKAGLFDAAIRVPRGLPTDGEGFG